MMDRMSMLRLLLVAGCLTFCHGFSSPARKTWWTKRINSDKFHTAGRLTERQIKYAAEADFTMLIALFNYADHIGDVSAPGGSYYPSTAQTRNIASETMANIPFEALLESGEDWKTAETVAKLSSVIRANPDKKYLFFCNRAYGSTFLMLAHFANVTRYGDNVLEPQVQAKDVFRIGADIGFDYSKDTKLVQLISALTGESELTDLATPTVSRATWHQDYWWMKPVASNLYISGQIQSYQLEAIAAAGIQTIINSRKGLTVVGTSGDVSDSQEEVTLLNIRDRTGTYTGQGRQSTVELEKSRLQPGRPTTYISASSTLNYEKNNSLEFGDHIGYNEQLESQAIRDFEGLEYIHLPVGGQVTYGSDLWKAYGTKITDAIRKGPVLLQCRTGFRSGALGVLAAAYVSCENSSWAVTKARALGYDYPSQDDRVVSMWREVLDGTDCTRPSDTSGAASHISILYWLVGAIAILVTQA